MHVCGVICQGLVEPDTNKYKCMVPPMLSKGIINVIPNLESSAN